MQNIKILQVQEEKLQRKGRSGGGRNSDINCTVHSKQCGLPRLLDYPDLDS